MGRVSLIRVLKPTSIKAFSSLSLLSVLFFSPLLSTSALAGSFSLRATGGVVHLPLSDWSNFFGTVINDGSYQKNNPNPLYGISVNCNLSPHHSLSLGTELVQTNASLSYIHYRLNEMGDTTGSWFSAVKWKFRGIPITLAYELSPFYSGGNFSPYIGAGASFFFSEVTAEVIDPYVPSKLKRTGKGYGLHGAIGFKSNLSPVVSTIWQARYRYANGMAFTDNEGDI